MSELNGPICKVNKLQLFKNFIESSDLARDARNRTLLEALQGSSRCRAAFRSSSGAQADTWTVLRWMVHQMRLRESLHDYETLGHLGQGAFGTVSLVRNVHSGRVRAMKQIPKVAVTKESRRQRVASERQFVGNHWSPWIVKLYSSFQDTDSLYMVMEYVPGRSLMHYLREMSKFDEPVARFYAAELLSAVEFVHSKGYIHRDVKPDNIMLTKEGHLKLLDFGLCRYDPDVVNGSENDHALNHGNQGLAEPGSPFTCSDSYPYPQGSSCSSSSPSLRHADKKWLRSSVGTPLYMAPEVFRGSYDARADLWSVGLVVFESLFGGNPFYRPHKTTEGPRVDDHKPDNDQKAGHYQNVDFNFDRELHRAQVRDMVLNYKDHMPIIRPPVDCSHAAAKFLNGLLCDMNQRMSIKQLRTHEFFCGLDFDSLLDLRPPISPTLHEVPKLDQPTGHQPRSNDYEPIGIDRDPEMLFLGYTLNSLYSPLDSRRTARSVQ